MRPVIQRTKLICCSLHVCKYVLNLKEGLAKAFWLSMETPGREKLYAEFVKLGSANDPASIQPEPRQRYSYSSDPPWLDPHCWGDNLTIFKFAMSSGPTSRQYEEYVLRCIAGPEPSRDASVFGVCSSASWPRST